VLTNYDSCISEAHERVLKRFIFEETEADAEATNQSTSLKSSASANSSRSSSNHTSDRTSNNGSGGAAAHDGLPLPSLQIVPLKGAAVDRSLALWHFLLGFAKPLKLRQLPHWLELHAAVHVVSGQAPPLLAESRVIGRGPGEVRGETNQSGDENKHQDAHADASSAAAREDSDGVKAAAPAAEATGPMTMVVATSLLSEVAMALTTCAREDHQPSLSHSTELAEVS